MERPIGGDPTGRGGRRAERDRAAPRREDPEEAVVVLLAERHLDDLRHWSVSRLAELRQEVLGRVLPVVDRFGGLVEEVRPRALCIAFFAPSEEGAVSGDVSAACSAAARRAASESAESHEELSRRVRAASGCADELVRTLDGCPADGTTLRVAAAVHVSAAAASRDGVRRLPSPIRREVQALCDEAADGVVARSPLVESLLGRRRAGSVADR